MLEDEFYQSVALSYIAGERAVNGQSMDVAKLQAGYTGAALVYSRNQALAHMRKADPPGHAAVTKFINDGTLLHHNAHCAKKSAHGVTRYHQYLIAGECPSGSYEKFKNGRRNLRNAQDMQKSSLANWGGDGAGFF